MENEKTIMQNAINFVVKKIIEQGGPSFDSETNQCVYFSDDGKRCAAGWLMRKVPGDNGGFDKRYRKYLSYEYEDLTTEFIQDLQECHDDIYFNPDGSIEPYFKNFYDNISYICKKYGLEKPEEIKNLHED